MNLPHLLPALSLLAASAAASDDPRASQLEVRLGPLIGGQDLILDVRSTFPGGSVALVFGVQAQPTPIAGLAIPALALAPVGYVVAPLDGAGRLRLVAPTISIQYAFAAGLPFFVQGAATALGAGWAVSEPTTSRFEPTDLTDYLPLAPAETFPAAVDVDGFGGAGLAQGDLTGDGLPELFFSRGDVAFGTWEVEIWRNLGDAQFAQLGPPLQFPFEVVGAMELADVDADGDYDFYTGGGYGGVFEYPDRLWRNDGAGGLSLDGAFPPGSAGTTDALFGDLDLDGDVDLIVAKGGDSHLGSDGAKDRLLLNDGTGLFTEQPTFDGAWNVTDASTQSIDAGDIDSDGDLDLILVRDDPFGLTGAGPGALNTLLLNRVELGSLAFDDASSRLVPHFEDNSVGVQFADVDLDGDLDLWVANSSLSVPRASSGDFYLNQGGAQGGVEGQFFDVQDPAIEDDTGARLRLGVDGADVDSDGDLDLFISVHELGQVGETQPLLINQGGAQGGLLGSFERADWHDPGAYISGQVLCLDLDLDGDTDGVQAASGALGSEPWPLRLRLFLNSTF